MLDIEYVIDYYDHMFYYYYDYSLKYKKGGGGRGVCILVQFCK